MFCEFETPHKAFEKNQNKKLDPDLKFDKNRYNDWMHCARLPSFA
jgi:hypothetical protein